MTSKITKGLPPLEKLDMNMTVTGICPTYPQNPYPYKTYSKDGNERAIYEILKRSELGQFCFEYFCEIWSGYDEKAVKLALTVARYTDDDINLLLDYPLFVDAIKGWFIGIACDGERACRIINIIWAQAKRFYPELIKNK